ncbi:1-deoxy-D-xylulose-5-phosphate synthase [Clostridium estertheticum]|uniref:1-deoxy-D-xylulose-5-phosphate synthase n=1 Tax=Clostridium estertheticum subsp. estertheticum TaxID=1552 RepID=A0A1J0GI29_9CLOT|nr:1-deoxy-D-xylulose-5-phosphate synthase [Clostridium estertheticum]APC41009.1 1-deoxy-D-xylulose-5-phosphate synthase [Clostridium estertheticum subsp. estertheticum]MBU3074073.1 1-deoxy-D-xylulose-5-phosphate synthase [Clostridium estertheticum]MBU3164167.1 1-deoxy-D-xylulose-5-phosphate synthase [Clostridium estertheticum]MBU3170103.1 1-deoxy-D-xylulose-5-phosphate synthase [Clostridium estertheticum]MBZ9617120.1 1-deoxy-D-xylulose-5-phosphate synthase [Clostridium estertheticum subsp. la
MSKILDNFNDINDIKKMTIQELNDFAKEIRHFLVEKVSKTGGHLASNLGVVELTLSLYNVFDLDKDKLIWDVGHQSYVHKILTGRKDKFDLLRNYGGLSGFPKREESKYDVFEAGHSSTSISAGAGIARARDLQKGDYNVISVIGDGALTGGMSFEALNDIGFRKTKMIIVLNDNQMSISKNVGGMSKYLSQFRIDPTYNRIKKEINSTLRKIPNVGDGMINSIQKIKNGIKQVVVPGMLFENMGITYLGPIDGHDIKEVSKVLKLAKKTDGPVIIHVITKKGKGYKFAEEQPNKFHGVGPFNPSNGELCSSHKESYSEAFGDQIVTLAKENKNIVAITAAMPEGTGLESFSKKFNNRFFDVGIAEQHAVTMAAGMASQGLKPIFAVYSTFLQRAYDQILHDVCIQNLPVIFAIDRAGIVGQDGETHQGIFDLSYLSHIPNMTIMAPKCIGELKTMLTFAVKQDYPIAIRYPRGGDNPNVKMSPINDLQRGKWETLLGGGKIAFIATGKMVQNAILVREKLLNMGIEATVVNACFIKPIDKTLLLDLVDKKYSLVTIEDNIVHGGLGSLVLEYVNSLNKKAKVINLGFNDEFIPHGSVDILYKLYKLDVDGIFDSILKLV